MWVGAGLKPHWYFTILCNSLVSVPWYTELIPVVDIGWTLSFRSCTAVTVPQTWKCYQDYAVFVLQHYIQINETLSYLLFNSKNWFKRSYPSRRKLDEIHFFICDWNIFSRPKYYLNSHYSLKNSIIYELNVSGDFSNDSTSIYCRESNPNFIFINHHNHIDGSYEYEHVFPITME